METTDIMVDLETLGNKPGCVILSIGAVRFNYQTKVVDEEFHEIINIRSSLSAGLKIDEETLEWWTNQTDEAKATLFSASSEKESLAIGGALNWFKLYLLKFEEVNIWGNGADFDNTILRAAFEATGITIPSWKFRNNRCYRTLKNLAPMITPSIERVGTHHNALDDAKSQAMHAISILRVINGCGA